jgi:hypothetical protein
MMSLIRLTRLPLRHFFGEGENCALMILHPLERGLRMIITGLRMQKVQSMEITAPVNRSSLSVVRGLEVLRMRHHGFLHLLAEL